MTVIILSLLMGIVAGLRTMTAPAAVAIGARYGLIAVAGTPLAFMGYTWTPWILCVLAVGELITDQLPTTPSRKVPMQFGARILSGALAGATLAASQGLLVAGVIAGIIGAVVGTLGGAAFRARLAATFGRDLPAALIEDGIAIGGAVLIVLA
ncbi:MAG: DUF4126 domain-containing protein [Steroidobacteraceae bacterium]